MKAIFEDVKNYIDSHEIPNEVTPFGIKYDKVNIYWGYAENPKFEIFPVKKNTDWVRKLDEYKLYIGIQPKDSEIRQFPISEEDWEILYEFLEGKYREWDKERRDQIELVLNG